MVLLVLIPKDVLAQQSERNSLSVPKRQEEVPPSNFPLFVLKEVDLQNSSVFTSKEVNEMAKDYLGQAVDLSDLLKIQEKNSLISKLTLP
ncbi:POTRA domain-containing protein [Gloeothece verrucosa]|nr:POTRA domain-containing protein [Gloeothece verrucosa]